MINQPPVDTTLLASLVEFVAHEAQLIDEQRYDEWLALFAEDGHYWVPAHRDQTDPDNEPALAYEDLLLLRVRIDRLGHPQAHSQKPASHGVHVLQTPRLTGENNSSDGPDYTLRTPFTYAEQRGQQQITLTGVVTHHVTQIDGTLRIKRKRVDLLGADSALPMIQLFP